MSFVNPLCKSWLSFVVSFMTVSISSVHRVELLDEEYNEKYLEGNGCGQIKILSWKFSCRGREGTNKTVRILGVLAEKRTVHFPSTSVEHYRYSNQLDNSRLIHSSGFDTIRSVPLRSIIATDKRIRQEFMPIQLKNGSRDSSVGIASGYGLHGWEVGVRIPVGSRIFHSQRRTDRLWGPPNLLSNGYRAFFPRG
jgi:hypothetical protein